MGTSPGLFFWQDKLGKNNPHTLQLTWQITGATTITPIPVGTPVLTTFTAIAAQTTIDSFLGTTNEFLIAQFDATSMGIDSFGVIVDMNGQVDTLFSADAFFDAGTYVPRSVPAAATLTSSSLTTQAAVGANGNLAMRAVLTGLDAATSGILCVRFHFRSK